MAGSRVPYILLLLALLAFNASIFITPYLASQGDQSVGGLYAAFSPTCHQLTSRSLCLYKYDVDGRYSIGDCLPMSTFSPSKANEVYYPEKTAYKMPVCSRDVAIYQAMLVGMLLLPFLWEIEADEWPNRWILVVAAIPIAIDGTTQLVGLRESTNLLRIVTGAIIGIVLPFYLLPLLNSVYCFLQAKFFPKKKGLGAARARKKKGAKK